MSKKRTRNSPKRRRLKLWKLAEAQGWRCAYCGSIVDYNLIGHNSRKHLNKATIDHIIPISNGGTDSHDNLVVSCNACNFIRDNEDAYTYWRWRRDKVFSSTIFKDNSIVQKLFEKRYVAIYYGKST